MDTKGRLIAGSHNRNEFVLINADEIGRVSAVRNLIFLLVWLPSLKLSSFFWVFGGGKLSQNFDSFLGILDHISLILEVSQLFIFIFCVIFEILS